MTQYYTQTTYAPTPAEKRKDTIREWAFQQMLHGDHIYPSRVWVDQLVAGLTYLYDAVEVLPDPPNEDKT